MADYIFTKGVAAEQGKLKLKTERIHEENNEVNLQETELEKVFPELFQESTQEKIATKQEEINDTEGDLKALLFEKDKMLKKDIFDNSLFDEQYIAVQSKSTGDEVEDDTSSISAQTFIISMAIIIFVVFGIVYMINKRESSR